MSGVFAIIKAGDIHNIVFNTNVFSPYKIPENEREELHNGDVKSLSLSIVFNSGHRNQVTCSLLGGFSKPRAEVIQLLDSGLCSI